MAATSPAKKSSPASHRVPIEGYDRLPVREILPRLTSLNGPELRAVTAYERAGKNRVTLLRAVRKVELARDAATPATPASHLTVVEDDMGSAVGSEWVLDEPDADLDEADVDELGDWVDEGEPEAVADGESDDETDGESQWGADDTEIVAGSEWSIDDPGTDGGWGQVDDPEDEDEVESASVPEVAAELPDPHPIAAAAGKKSRKRPAVKGATWEEELRPQLPRRIESTSFDLEPPIVALPAPEPVLNPVAARGKAHATGPAKVRKFEGPALVMAAVLAVLLGLAIGTVLARSGGTDSAQPAPVTVEAAAAPVAG